MDTCTCTSNVCRRTLRSSIVHRLACKCCGYTATHCDTHCNTHCNNTHCNISRTQWMLFLLQCVLRCAAVCCTVAESFACGPHGNRKHGLINIFMNISMGGYIYTYICVYIYIYVYMFIYIFICIHIYTYVYMYTRVYKFIFISIYTYIHILTHQHAHTYTCSHCERVSASKPSVLSRDSTSLSNFSSYSERLLLISLRISAASSMRWFSRVCQIVSTHQCVCSFAHVVRFFAHVFSLLHEIVEPRLPNFSNH